MGQLQHCRGPHLIDQVRTGRAEFFADEITRFDRLEANAVGMWKGVRLVYIRLSSWMNLTLC